MGGATPAIASPAAVRLAVIDIGAEPVPSGLAELVFAELAGHAGIALVERQRVDAILREQHLSLTLGDSQASARVGRLVAADCLLLLEAGAASPAGQPVRMSLVQSATGLRLWDGLLVTGPAREIPALARTVAAQAASRAVVRVRDGVPVAVARLENRGASTSWDWLSGSLGAALEIRLGTIPRLIVAERHRARSLLEERELTTSLPPAIRASAILIDGDYSVERSQHGDTIHLMLRARRGAQVLVETKVTGTVEGLDELTGVAVTRLLPSIGSGEMDPMQAASESALLVRQAEEFLLVADTAIPLGTQDAFSNGVIPLIESALSLTPDRFEAHALHVRAVNSLVNRARSEDDASRAVIQRTVVPRIIRSMHSARRLLMHERFPAKDEHASGPAKYYRREALFRSIRRVFMHSSRLWEELGADAGPLVHALQPSLRSLQEDCVSATALATDGEFDDCLVAVLTHGTWWNDSPEGVVLDVRRAVERAAGAPHGPAAGVLSFLSERVIHDPRWPTDDRARLPYVAMLHELSDHSVPAVRAFAARALAEHHASPCRCCGVLGLHGRWDERCPRRPDGCVTVPSAERDERLRAATELHERFTALLMSDVLPSTPPGRLSASAPDGTYFDALLAATHPVGNLDEQYLARQSVPVFDAVFRRGLERHVSWQYHLGATVERLERAGAAHEARDLVLRARAALESRGAVRGQAARIETLRTLLEGIGERNPELGVATSRDDALAVRAERVFGVSSDLRFPGWEPGADLRFHGLVRTDSHLVLIAAADHPLRDGLRFGIVRLDPATWRPVELQVGGRTDIDEQSANHRMSFDRRGPAACARGDDVFLGFFDTGIAWFPPHGDPKALDEEAGLPAQSIVELTAVGDRLYAIVGTAIVGLQVAGDGLMEVDLRGSRATLLLSPRGRPDGGDLQRSAIVSLAPGPSAGTLYLNTSNEGPEPGGFGLHVYEPATRRARALSRVITSNAFLEPAGESGTLLYSDDRVALIGGDEVRWLYRARGVRFLRQQPHVRVFDRVYPETPWSDTLTLNQCVVVHGGMLCAVDDPGADPSDFDPLMRLALFDSSRERARLLTVDGLPTETRFVKVARHGRHALALTHDGLYSIELSGTPRGGAAAARHDGLPPPAG